MSCHVTPYACICSGSGHAWWIWTRPSAGGVGFAVWDIAQPKHASALGGMQAGMHAVRGCCRTRTCTPPSIPSVLPPFAWHSYSYRQRDKYSIHGRRCRSIGGRRAGPVLLLAMTGRVDWLQAPMSKNGPAACMHACMSQYFDRRSHAWDDSPRST